MNELFTITTGHRGTTYAPAVTGIQRREAGKDSVSANCEAFLGIIREEAKRIVLEQGKVTCDDLRRYASTRGIEPEHQNAWGAVFRGGEWECVGHCQSTVPSTHAREIKVWRLKSA